MVFAYEHVQKSKRPTMSTAKSNGDDCVAEPLMNTDDFVSLNWQRLIVERPSI